MDDLVARDPRVVEILSSPDDYFARARARAWLVAGYEVAWDLDRREFRRRNGARYDHGPDPAHARDGSNREES